MGWIQRLFTKADGKLPLATHPPTQQELFGFVPVETSNGKSVEIPVGHCRGVMIRNQEAFGSPAMRELYLEAFTPHEGKSFANPIDAIEWSFQNCMDPQVSIIVAVSEQDTFRGLAIAEYSPGPWTLGPWVLHHHSTGIEALRAMCAVQVEWLRSIGQDTIFGLNQMTPNDAVHIRYFRSHFDGAKFASLNAFTIREDIA